LEERDGTSKDITDFSPRQYCQITVTRQPDTEGAPRCLGTRPVSRQRPLMQTRCSRRLRVSRGNAAARGSAVDDRAAAGTGGAASAQEDRDGDDDEPGQAQSDADPGRRPVAQARGDDDAAEP